MTPAEYRHFVVKARLIIGLYVALIVIVILVMLLWVAYQ